MKNFELEAIDAMIEGKLTNYGAEIAKVKSVSDEGLRVDVETLTKAVGSKPIEKVLVAKNPYINAPIQAGDFVMLLKTAYCLGTFSTSGTINQQVNATMNIAVPIATKTTFKAKNETQITSTKADVTIDITDDKGIEIACKQDFKSECNTFSVTAKQPLEVACNAGSLLDVATALIDLCDGLKGAALVAGQATLTWLPTYDAKKVEVEQKIKQILK